MGQRNRYESVAKVIGAFLTRRTWSQADLARQVGLGTEALRKLLEELRDGGAVPLESEKDHPHVYWSVPRAWHPGGVLFEKDDVPELLRQLTHLPRSKARDRLLAKVAEQLPGRGKPAATAPVITRPTSEHEEQYVPLVEEAAARKVSLWMRYLTASRATVGERHVSVHLLDIGPPARFIATCHRSGDLRWFRVDGVIHARLDDREPFRACAPATIDAYRAQSLDGYKGDGAPIACSFFVRQPESRWVANNLLDGMRVETLHDGIRVQAETSGVLRLARAVVGYGAAARPESAELAEAVAELARGALEQAEAALRDQENRARSEDVPSAPARPRSDV